MKRCRCSKKSTIVPPNVQASPRLIATLTSPYGVCLAKLAKYDEAREPLEKSSQQLISAGLEKSEPPRCRERIIDVTEHSNRPDEAAKWREVQAKLTAATQPTTKPSS